MQKDGAMQLLGSKHLYQPCSMDILKERQPHELFNADLSTFGNRVPAWRGLLFMGHRINVISMPFQALASHY